MNKRSIIGLLIIGVGLLLLAGSLGYIKTEGLWSTFWPVILIGIGLANLADKPRKYTFGIIMTLLGTIFLLKNLGFDVLRNFHFWDLFWPVIIIVVGIWFLTSKNRTSFGSRSEISDDVIETLVIFSGSNSMNQSQEFKGGQMTAIFGGIDLDLRSANITEAPAKIDVFAAFGGVDIKVPQDWRVKVTGIPIFGGWGNKTYHKENVSKDIDLEINCLVLFGGFDVKN